MRDVKYTTRFQRDYKREKSGRHSKKLDTLLMEVVNLLAADTPLACEVAKGERDQGCITPSAPGLCFLRGWTSTEIFTSWPRR